MKMNFDVILQESKFKEINLKRKKKLYKKNPTNLPSKTSKAEF